MTASLSGILKRGVGYSAVGVVVCQLAVIVQTIALGRILGPGGEVGVYAAGSVLSGFLLAFTQSTLAQALIQRDDDIEDAANTVLIVTFAAGGSARDRSADRLAGGRVSVP